MMEAHWRGGIFRVLCRIRTGHLERVSSTALASPPLPRVPKAGSPWDASLLASRIRIPCGFPRRPGTPTPVPTSHPTPGPLGTPYLPSPARSCMVWVRVATGEKVAARSGDPQGP